MKRYVRKHVTVKKRLHDEANALGGARKEDIAEGRLAERNALIEKCVNKALLKIK